MADKVAPVHVMLLSLTDIVKKDESRDICNVIAQKGLCAGIPCLSCVFSRTTSEQKLNKITSLAQAISLIGDDNEP